MIPFFLGFFTIYVIGFSIVIRRSIDHLIKHQKVQDQVIIDLIDQVRVLESGSLKIQR